jgi:hypothetical protein
VSTIAIVAVAIGAFACLSWLSWRRDGTLVAPGGVGAVGGGTAMVAVGGVLVAKGHWVAGALLDVAGVVSIWAGFKTYSGN